MRKKLDFDWEDSIRRLPLSPDECYPIQSEPMFDVILLRKAYDYYTHYIKANATADEFVYYLLCLEKDVPFNQQKP